MGYVNRRWREKIYRKILSGKVEEQKPIMRPNRKGENNIKMCALSQNRDLWRRVCEHDRSPSSDVKDREFPSQLRDYRLK
jgi:hypothetical protein